RAIQRHLHPWRWRRSRSRAVSPQLHGPIDITRRDSTVRPVDRVVVRRSGQEVDPWEWILTLENVPPHTRGGAEHLKPTYRRLPRRRRSLVLGHWGCLRRFPVNAAEQGCGVRLPVPLQGRMPAPPRRTSDRKSWFLSDG